MNVEATKHVREALHRQYDASSRIRAVEGGLLRSHWPALALAAIIGLLTASPSLWAKVGLGVDFDHPVNIREDDEHFYFARIREVLDGHPTIGNPFLWEHKSKPSPQFLGEWLLAQPIKFFGLGVVASGVFYELLLPAVAALLTYASTLATTRFKPAALLATAFLFLGLFPGRFARIVSPQFNFLFWLTEFLFLWLLFVRAENTRGRRIFTFLAAVNLGLLIYLYPWYATFYLAFLGIFGVLRFLHGDRSATPWIVALGGLIFATPYFLILARDIALPEYAETVRRIGLLDSRFPSGLRIVSPGIVVLIITLILARLRVFSWNGRAMFLVSGVIAAMVSTNQHMVTGKYFQFSGHYDKLSVFWFTFSAAFLIAELWRYASRWRTMLLIAASVVVLGTVAVGFPKFAARFENQERSKAHLDRYLPVLDWIARHTSRDEVVYAPIGLADLIPIYTHANVYFATNAYAYFTSDAEILDRFVLSNYYETMDRGLVVSHFLSIYGIHDLDLALRATRENYVRALLRLPVISVDRYPAEAVERVLKRARELQSAPFDRELRRFRVDYVVWDRKSQPAAAIDSLPNLQRVYDHDGFLVYRVRPF